ncbi:glycine cleavage system protein GcvH [Kribbella sp. CA-293567]|uniref:glycine cleavage system protein GcvH n=1 Tax=Kribbella sp. CA-293567 TaxID=3002436 RepID=UPI0022DD4CAE|nr:glycine cleavage system protein GcvH [Kribbella sp. CA-293567]WBQ04796.1 glycine cleavage system protein GcvH [Kribbella sp. CA-293567]
MPQSPAGALPGDDRYRYTAGHEWLCPDAGGLVLIGVTAFAADALGDIIFLDLPPVGTALTAGAAFGEIESTKSVGDLHAPAGGEVAEVNEAAVAEPGLLNSDPFGAGWLVKLRLTEEPAGLLDAAAYTELIERGE